MSRPRATSTRCVMNQPARRRTDADATETNQLDVTGIFCGKLLRCPVRNATEHHSMKEHRINTGLFALSTVKWRAGMAALRRASGDFIERTHGKIAAQACLDPTRSELNSNPPVDVFSLTFSLGRPAPT